MTVAKVWDGTQWVPVVGAQGPPGPRGPAGAGGLLDVYRQDGENNAYSVLSASPTTVTVDAAKTKPLQWVYTPAVNCWVEVFMQSGFNMKNDAAYHYCQLNAAISPVTGVVGSTGYSNAVTQHSGVQQYEPRSIQYIVGLAAGTTYTMNFNWTYSGGSWQFYQGPGLLLLTGKAYAR